MNLEVTLIHFIPLLFLIIGTFVLLINIKVRVFLILFFYFLWALLLGSRSIFEAYESHGILYFDPLTYSLEAKQFTIIELFLFTFPSVDILLQLIMMMFYSFTSSDMTVMIMTETLIVTNIFISLKKIYSKNTSTGLILFLFFLVFSNTGVLIVSNFLRQGLAISFFFMFVSFDTGKEIRITSSILDKLLYLCFVVFWTLILFFSHTSSIILIFFYLFAKYGSIKKIIESSKLYIFLILLLSVLSMYFLDNFIERYNAYEGYYEEGVSILYLKILVDIILFIVMSVFFKNIIVNNSIIAIFFKMCIYIGIIILLFSKNPIVALRIEYYLNTLLFCLLIKLIIETMSMNFRRGRRIVVTYIILMYLYSFAVYSHGSVKRVLVYKFNLENAN